MMTDFLIYDLKVGVLIAVCYLFFRLLIERETLHRLSRVVLLASLVLSFVLPLCIITFHQTVWIKAPKMTTEAVATPAVVAYDGIGEVVGSVNLVDIIGVVLLAGILIRLIVLALSYLKLHRLLSAGDRRLLDDGTPLCIIDAPIAPFSWWDTIVVNRDDYHSSDYPTLLIHERSHIRLHHSWDVVFVEVLTALQWFNPVVWLLSRDLRTIHEYEADEAVLSQGVSMAQYVSLLACKATGMRPQALVNGINNRNLKKRIHMMTKRKSSRCAWLKALYIIPIAALSLAMTAKTVTDYRTLPVSDEADRTLPVSALEADSTPPVSAVKASEEPIVESCIESPEVKPALPTRTQVVSAQRIPEDSIVESPSVKPVYPGGEAEMLRFWGRNAKYPVKAAEYGVYGCMIVQFVVEKDGSITHITTEKSGTDVGKMVVSSIKRPDRGENEDLPDTDEEKKLIEAQKEGWKALMDESCRVVKLMPKWAPGKLDGKAVRTRVRFPLTFKLQ